MKAFVWIIIITLLFALPAMAQSKFLPFSPKQEFEDIYETMPNITISAGFVPESTKHAIKNTVMFNNFMFSRMGAYMTFESGIKTEYSTNLVGLTATIHRYFYFWVGVDLLSQNGALGGTSVNNVAKELGITFTPFSQVVLKVGWSSGNDFTYEAGIRIPLYNYQ